MRLLSCTFGRKTVQKTREQGINIGNEFFIILGLLPLFYNIRPIFSFFYFPQHIEHKKYATDCYASYLTQKRLTDKVY